MKNLNYLFVCSTLLLAIPSFAGQTLSAIENPDDEENYQEAPIAEASSKHLGRNHWYDDLSIEGEARRKAAAKKKRVIVVEDEDQPEYVMGKSPARQSRVASKIDQALDRKVAMLRQQLNQKVMNVVENMNVEVR